jgi:hypothetical protein
VKECSRSHRGAIHIVSRATAPQVTYSGVCTATYLILSHFLLFEFIELPEELLDCSVFACKLPVRNRITTMGQNGFEIQ